MADIDPGLLAVLIIAGVFIVWYFAGAVWNRRLARRLANEIRDSLVSFGGSSKIQTYGTTAFRMTTEGANPPFRDISLVVTLQPREMPLNWALARAQGRRDVAVLEASLRQAPRIGFELIDPTSRIGKRRARAKESWSPTTLAGREYLLSSKNGPGVEGFLRRTGDDALTNISALHVTAGSEPGIAASLALEEGKVAPALTGLRALAQNLTA